VEAHDEAYIWWVSGTSKHVDRYQFHDVRPEALRKIEGATSLRTWPPGGSYPNPWPRYNTWNSAIEAYFFRGRYANKPVYLDLEEQSLAAIAEMAGDSASAFVEAVSPTLALPPNDDTVFGAHLQRAKAWVSSGRIGIPPFLALLAFFSLVAERMRTDSKFSASNYYGRLCSMLGLPGDAGPAKTKVQNNYMHQVPPIWSMYNEWVDADKGARGRPTAFPFDSRVHVGVPISQALVRESDRGKLWELFLTYRLQPGQQIAPSDMARLLRDWLPAASVSSALKNLMQQPEGLEHAADVACLELQAWDGTTPDQAEASGRVSAASIALAAHLRRYPRPSLEFGVIVHAVAPLPAGTYSLPVDASEHARAAFQALGARVELLAPHMDGWQAIHDDNQISIPDLLFAQSRLNCKGFEIHRDPRRLVILENDEATFSFVEVPRAHLGRDLLLLCVDALAHSVAELLEGCARPGYRHYRAADLPGVPIGWSLFSDVQLMSIPNTSNPDLATIVPVAWTEIVLSGGYRLPGRATWLLGHLPEVRVSSPSAMGELAVLLTNEAHPDGEEPLGLFTGHVVILLAGRHLPEGDYRILVTERVGARRALASAGFHIRSAAQPRFLRGDERTTIAHPLASSDGWAMLSAIVESKRSASASVIGAQVGGVDEDAPRPTLALPCALGEAIDWSSDDSEFESIVSVQAKAGEPPDCLKSGAHWWLLPPAGPEQPRWNAKILGTCKYCRLEKWYPAHPRSTAAASNAARRGQSQNGAQSRPSLPQSKGLDLRPVEVESGFGYAELIDAMAFARRGPWSWLEGLASQVREEPTFPGEAAQVLSALGHLELVLDRQTLRPVEWAMPATTLATTFEEDTTVLCGWRSPSLLDRLAHNVLQLGGNVSVGRGDGQTPPVVLIFGLDEEALALVSATVSDGDHEVMVSTEPARKLAARLSPLSVIQKRLPTFVPPVGFPLEHWDPQTNRWGTVDDVIEPGAYRTRSLPRRYGFRSMRATGRTLARGDTRLVKWLAAREHGVSLLGYDEPQRLLTCRIGAGLPGLYERVAALCSGLPPGRTAGTIVYRSVPRTVAGAIWEALMA